MKEPISPAKNIASAARNIKIARRALLTIGSTSVEVGGEGGPPPAKLGTIASSGSSIAWGSTILRAVNSRAIITDRRSLKVTASF